MFYRGITRTQAAIALFVIFLSAIFYPFGLIWALNTLFPVLAIPYNFYSWLSVFIIMWGVRASISLN